MLVKTTLKIKGPTLRFWGREEQDAAARSMKLIPVRDVQPNLDVRVRIEGRAAIFHLRREFPILCYFFPWTLFRLVNINYGIYSIHCQKFMIR